MQALKFPEAGRSEIVDVPAPTPQEAEVLVRVRAAGICASDVAAFQGKHDARRPPVITGHELAGEIVQAGGAVTSWRVGDRVAVEPHLGCSRCFYCRQGHYHECPDKRLLGVGDWIGAFAEYVVVHESMCHRLPEGMTYEEGATLEPFCVGLHAVRRARLEMGEHLAVLGVGTIGMMTLLAARGSTPGRIVVTDLSAFKRQVALRSGADAAIDPATQDSIAAVRRETGGLGADVVFVAASAPDLLAQGLEMTRRMGRLVVIASYFKGGSLDVRQVQLRERVVIGTSMYTGEDYRLAIRLWEQGSLKSLGSLITDRITLDQAPAMIAALAGGHKPDVLKAVIRFD